MGSFSRVSSPSDPRQQRSTAVPSVAGANSTPSDKTSILGAVILTLAVDVTAPLVLPASQPTALVTHTSEARICFNGKVSTTQVQASDAGQAKKLVQAQFPTATVLSVKRID